MKKQLTLYEKRSWKLVWLCVASYVAIVIGRKNLSVCLSDMVEDGVISQTLGGGVGTSFLVCYAIGQLCSGFLGDLVHPRYMISGGLAMAGVMNICMGLNSSPIMFLVIWGACGLSCSMLWAPIIRAVSTWTDDYISHVSGIALAATTPAGTMLSYLICALGLKISGWRLAFFMCGGVLLISSAVIFALFCTLRSHMAVKAVKNEENPTESADGSGQAKNSGSRAGIAAIFSVGLVFTSFSILFNGMLKDGLDLWIPTVLRERFIPNASAVSLICTVLPAFNVFGALAAQFISRKFKLDEMCTTGVLFSFSTVSLGIVALLIRFVPASDILTPGRILAVAAVTVLLALSSTAMLGANTMLLTYIPLHYSKIGRAATLTGMLNCFSYAAASVSEVIVGAVSASLDWDVVFWFFGGAALLGAVFSFAGHKPMEKKIRELDGME